MKHSFLHQPIFVTGAQRSGASIIAKILQVSGAWTGTVTSMYENKRIKRLLQKYYREVGADPDGQYPLPDTTKIKYSPFFKDAIFETLKYQHYDPRTPWFFKNHRICQTWPLWYKSFPKGKYIIVRRKPPEVINSCFKTAFMKAFSDKRVQQAVGVDSEYDGWMWWIHQHEQNQIEMFRAGLDCRVIWPDRMLDGDYSQIVSMLDWVGLKWNAHIIPEVERLLQKHK